jgi:ribosomal protein uL24
MSVLSPQSPRRQRKAGYDATNFERRVRMTVPLSRELRRRFHTRSIPIRKGDTVRVMSGSFVGREERVAKVDRRGYTVTLDNVTLKSGESKLKPLAIRTSHLVLTKLNLADGWRREILQVRADDLTPEERGEAVEVVEPEPAAPTPSEPTDGAAASKDADAPVVEKAPKPGRKRASAAKKEDASA